MEKLYIEGLATHDDREPCVGTREGGGEASVAARAGQAIEPRNHRVRGAHTVQDVEGHIVGGASASRRRTPRGQRTRACMEPPCARTGRSHCSPTWLITGWAARGTLRRYA